MSMNVSIFLRLVDKLTGPAKKAANSWKSSAQQVTASARQVGAASGQAAAGIGRVNQAAASASVSLGRMATQMRNIRTVGRGLTHFGGAGTIMGFPVVQAVKRFADFEDKVLDLQKVFPGTADQFDNTAEALRRLSYQIPLARNDIMKLAEEAAKANIIDMLNPDGSEKTAEQIASSFTDYIQTASHFAVAFGLDIDTTAETLARLKSSLGITVPELVELGDSLNHVANNSAATEKGILEIMRRNAALGKAIGGKQGITSILAIGAAQEAAGVRPEVAATGLRTLLVRLQQAAGMQRSQKDLRALGLDDEEIEDMRKGLKTSSDALRSIGLDPAHVASGLTTDTVGTIKEVLFRISQLTGDERGAVLGKLAGMRALDSVIPLVANLELLDKAWNLANDPDKAGSMLREYEIRSKGLNAQLQLLRNTFENISDKAVGPFMQHLKDGIQWISKWAEENENMKILTWAAGVAIAFAALSAIVLPLGLFVMALGAIGPVLWAILLPLRLLARIAVGGLFGGLLAGAGKIGRLAYNIHRFAGAAGIAVAALRALRRALKLFLIWEAGSFIWDNWDKIKKTLEDPVNIDVHWPDAPDWLKWLMSWTSVQDGAKMLNSQIESSREYLWDGSALGLGKLRYDDLPFFGSSKPDVPTPALPQSGDVGVPSILRGRGGVSVPQQASGPTTNNVDNSKTVNVGGINVTVNATTNASPGAIGSAAGSAVGAQVRSATNVD